MKASEVTQWLSAELARLTAIHKVQFNHVSVAWNSGTNGDSWAVHACGECRFGSTPDEAASKLMLKIDPPAKLAKEKREYAERLIAEAAELEAQL